MKLINPSRIISVPNTIPTGKLVWVDAENGNDKLAARSRLGVPFKTLTAAKNAAQAASGGQAGDTIMVMPGIYNENNLLKNGVNWHFLPGAVVHFTSTGAAAIFSATTAVEASITGHGIFKISADPTTSGNDTSRRVIHASAASILHVEALDLTSDVAEAVNIVSDSSLHLNARNILSPVDALSVNSSAASVRVYAESIKTTGLSAFGIYLSAGSLSVRAQEIISESWAAINASGAGMDVEVQAALISGGSDAVFYEGYLSRLRIVGARIKAAGGYAVYLDGSTPEGLTLTACSLVPDGTGDSIYSTNAATVCCAGVVSKTAVNTAVTTDGLFDVVPSAQ
jgi:hypothetical protein